MAVSEEGHFSRVPPPPGLYDKGSRGPSIMASGKSALLQLLERNSMKSEVSEYLTKAGCLSVAQLANWVDKKEDLLEAVLKRTDLKDDQSQLASLKMAWR